jgi:hypothetical protein
MSRRGGKKGKDGAIRPAATADATVSSPLAAFWELLDLRQKAAILQVKLQALKSIHLCSHCKRLLKAAWAPTTGDLNTVHDAYDIPWGYTLMRLQDGSYVTEDTRTTLSPQKVLEFTITPYPDVASERCFQYRGPYDGEVFRYANRIPDVPPNACWYCHDKIYLRFIDMLTYPRPPRRFTMLLCRDDRVRALKQVLAAEVGLESPGRLVLQHLGKTLDDDNASMQSLGVANGQLIVITKRPVLARLPPDASDGGVRMDGGAELPSSSSSSSEDEGSSRSSSGSEEGEGLGEGGEAAASSANPGVPVAGAIATAHRYDAEGSEDEEPVVSLAARPGAVVAASGDPETASSQALVPLSQNSSGGHADQVVLRRVRRHAPLAPASGDDDSGSSGDGSSSVQQNKRFVAELLLGATGYSNSRSGGVQSKKGDRSGALSDKFAGLPTNESPPVSPRGPVASVDRRHGYSVLGCMLSHFLFIGISQAWDADVSALRAQEALIAECESERQVSPWVGTAVEFCFWFIFSSPVLRCRCRKRNPRQLRKPKQRVLLLLRKPPMRLQLWPPRLRKFSSLLPFL